MALDLTMTDAVLFDLDGVLVDSRVPFSRSVNAALLANGLSPCRDEDLYRYLGPPLHHTFEQLGAGDLVQECVDTYRDRYRARAAAETSVTPGIPEALTDLSTQMPLVVATSKPRALAEPLLEALNLRQFFHAVVGPDLAVKHESKGSTIKRALGLLPPGRRPVMIGDRSFDVIGANEHGVPTIGVLWGIGSATELT